MDDLPEYHKRQTKYKWKIKGVKWKEGEFEEVYERYIITTHCELCDKKFISRDDRRLDHNHVTGEFRDIVCSRCNALKYDVKIRVDNRSGYPGIGWAGKTWRFRVVIDGKKKYIKCCTDLGELVEFADRWKIDNNYYT